MTHYPHRTRSGSAYWPLSLKEKKKKTLLAITWNRPARIVTSSGANQWELLFISRREQGEALRQIHAPAPSRPTVTSARLTGSGLERSPRAGGGAAPRCWEGRAGRFLQPSLRQLPSPSLGCCAALVPGRSRLPQRPEDMREREWARGTRWCICLPEGTVETGRVDWDRGAERRLRAAASDKGESGEGGSGPRDVGMRLWQRWMEEWSRGKTWGFGPAEVERDWGLILGPEARQAGLGSTRVPGARAHPGLQRILSRCLGCRPTGGV